jgi:hypothetical protein
VQGSEAAAVGPSRANVSGARAPTFPGHCDRIQAQTSEQKRRRGAPLGNRRAWRHGRRSAGAIEKRKAGAAARKAAGLILARLALLGDYRHRPRPIRPDQHRHLGDEALAILAGLGLVDA